MRHLPERSSRVAGAVDRQNRDRLATWMQAWQIDQALGAGGEADPERVETDFPARSEAANAASAAAATRAPAPRQVLLLHPSVAGAARRPVYVAVLSRATPFLYLAIPYSRFATPAVPGEMEASRAARPLRVWCAWNARLLHAAALASGWVADRLTVAECRAGLAAVAVASGERAADALETAAGPPLSHPADPRHVYLRQESALMDAVVACGAATGGILLPWPAENPPAAATVALARAAEAPEAYRREICYRVVGSDVVLRCAAATAGQPGCIEVQTPGGAASQLLDGAVIATRRRAVTIASGRALLRGDERAGGFTLFSADGRPLRLV